MIIVYRSVMMKWMNATIIYESMRKSDIDIKERLRDKVGTKWRRNTRYAGIP
jgi:hypothetical protein